MSQHPNEAQTCPLRASRPRLGFNSNLGPEFKMFEDPALNFEPKQVVHVTVKTWQSLFTAVACLLEEV